MGERDGFYAKAIATLQAEKIPFLVGGAFGLKHYTGIHRDTKDLDIFLREEDCGSALRVLASEGFRTELTDKLWLAKAFDTDGAMIDLIFSSGNGLCPVDDRWFIHATPGGMFGLPVKVVPVEEMIFSKAFIMARDRYDGADIAHLLLTHGEHLNWKRLLERFGSHWRVLFSHLVLFPYIYPSHTQAIPQSVWDELLRKFSIERAAIRSAEKICRGTLLNRTCYQVDAVDWGFEPRESA